MQTTSSIVREEVFGPVIVAQTFRTPTEAVALANNTEFGLGAGVWTENIGLAAETAMGIKAGVIWVNSHNMFDAAAGFGGYKQSGFGREGGKEGLYSYIKPSWQKSPPLSSLPSSQNSKKWGTPDLVSNLPAPAPSFKEDVGKVKSKTASSSISTSLPSFTPSKGVDRTPKMYISINLSRDPL